MTDIIERKQGSYTTGNKLMNGKDMSIDRHKEISRKKVFQNVNMIISGF